MDVLYTLLFFHSFALDTTRQTLSLSLSLLCSAPFFCCSHRPLSDSDHTMEIWFECTTSGQRCAAEVGEGCSAADLQEHAVAVLYPQSVLSAEAVGLCVDGADGEVLAPEVLIADTALCAGGTVYVRKQDSSGVWVPKRYTVGGFIGDVCEDTLVLGARGNQQTLTINLVTTKVTCLPPVGRPLCKVVLMPHHIVYRSFLNIATAYFRPRASGAEVEVRMARTVERLVAMPVTEAVLIGTNEQIVQYSCEGVRMRTIDHCDGYSFAVSPCETLLLSNAYQTPFVAVYRLDAPELSMVHRVDAGVCRSYHLRPSFSPDASLAVLSCGDEHTVRTIDVISGHALCTLPIMNGACFSACSRYLFTASDRSVQQWDARSGAPMGRIDANRPWFVRASTDGCRLVVVEADVILVLDVAAFNMQVSEEDALQRPPSEGSRCSRCVCS